MNDSNLPFQLMAWIKRNQAEIQNHKEKMALKNYQDDKSYARLMSFIVQHWPKLKTFEKLMILRLTEQHESFRVMSPAQRSVITNMWIKYVA